jgi:phage tail sheath gpL-like
MPDTQISFNEVPNNIRVPGVYIEIDPSLANNAEDLQQILVIAPKGTAVANQVFLTAIPDQASDIFGEASEAHKMVSAIFDQTKALPISSIGVDIVADTDIGAALAALGDTQYHYIFCFYNEKANIDLLAEFLQERYHAMSQIPGLGFVGFKGTSSEVNAFAADYNSPFISIMAINELSLSISESMSAYYAQCAHSLAIDPARPLQTLQLLGVKTIGNTTEWTPTERNIMLYSGSSTYTTNTANDVFVERPITTYRENASGVADDSYLDIMTVATAMYFRAKQRSRILSRYPRHKLAKDGTNFAPGQAVLTPTLFKAAMFGLYRDLEEAGIVQDFDNYAETFICSIDPQNPTRINYQDQPMFINGLIIVAGKIQFRKN